MPKKVTPKPAVMGKQPKKKTAASGGPTKPVEKPLSVEEREELRLIFQNATFAKAFSNARLAKPPVFIGGLATDHAGQIATNQICRIQGWEMFEAALFMQTQDKPAPRKPLEENYADPALNP